MIIDFNLWPKNYLQIKEEKTINFLGFGDGIVEWWICYVISQEKFMVRIFHEKFAHSHEFFINFTPHVNAVANAEQFAWDCANVTFCNEAILILFLSFIDCWKEPFFFYAVRFSVATANKCIKQNINWSNRSNRSSPVYRIHAQTIFTPVWRRCLRSCYVERTKRQTMRSRKSPKHFWLHFTVCMEMCINQSEDVAYVQLCWHSTGGHVHWICGMQCLENHKCMWLVRIWWDSRSSAPNFNTL